MVLSTQSKQIKTSETLYLVDAAKEDCKHDDFEDVNLTHPPDDAADSVQKVIEHAPQFQCQQKRTLLQCYTDTQNSITNLVPAQYGASSAQANSVFHPSGVAE